VHDFSSLCDFKGAGDLSHWLEVTCNLRNTIARIGCNRLDRLNG
jgi:hypothetical protein